MVIPKHKSPIGILLETVATPLVLHISFRCKFNTLRTVTTNPDVANFDTIYVASTSVNPRYWMISIDKPKSLYIATDAF